MPTTRSVDGATKLVDVGGGSGYASIVLQGIDDPSRRHTQAQELPGRLRKGASIVASCRTQAAEIPGIIQLDPGKYLVAPVVAMQCFSPAKCGRTGPSRGEKPRTSTRHSIKPMARCWFASSEIKANRCEAASSGDEAARPHNDDTCHQRAATLIATAMWPHNGDVVRWQGKRSRTAPGVRWRHKK
jgi:hypothetical protein